MGRRGGVLLPIILLIIILGAAIWLRIKPPKDFVINRPTPVAVATPDATPSYTPIKKKGTITGSLSFPSEGIPSTIEVCAQNVNTNQLYCTDEQIEDDKYTYGLGYEILVPAGTYIVYAYDSSQPDSTKAYYSEFVTCGLSVDCPSHLPIEVEVEADETVTEVDPGDWYALPN